MNALAVGQSLSFNLRMTVVFGRNGSGKTGYVRILEAAVVSASRAEENPPRPHRRYAYQTDSERNHPIHLGGNGGPLGIERGCRRLPFTRVDVFDAQDAPTYVDGDLTYVYAPKDVASFRYVARAIKGVRSKLEAAKKEKAPGSNVFVGHFKRSAGFYTVIDTLGASTELGMLKKKHADEQADEAAAIEGLKVTVEALGDKSVSGHLTAAQADLDLCERAVAALERVQSFDAQRRDELIAKLNTAKARRASAGRDAFEPHQLPGFMTAQWNAFVEAAKSLASEGRSEQKILGLRGCLLVLPAAIDRDRSAAAQEVPRVLQGGNRTNRGESQR